MREHTEGKSAATIDDASVAAAADSRPTPNAKWAFMLNGDYGFGIIDPVAAATTMHL